MTFDPLQFASYLRERSHFTDEQVDDISDAIADALSSIANVDCATKPDLNTGFAEIRNDIAALRQETESSKKLLEARLLTRVERQTVVIGCMIAAAIAAELISKLQR